MLLSEHEKDLQSYKVQSKGWGVISRLTAGFPLLRDVQRFCCEFIWIYFSFFYIKQKQTILCLKCKSLNINFWFLNCTKSISHLQSDIWENSSPLSLILLNVKHDIIHTKVTGHCQCMRKQTCGGVSVRTVLTVWVSFSMLAALGGLSMRSCKFMQCCVISHFVRGEQAWL